MSYFTQVFFVFVFTYIFFNEKYILIRAKVPDLPLPSYVGKACRANDPNLNECVVRTGAPVIRRIVQGDPKYRIPKLEPLTIPEMRIQQGTPQVGLTMQCKNCNLYGLSEVKFIAARANLKGKHAEWDFHVDRIMFLGKYKVTGKVLILPIVGEGDANITITNADFSFIYDYILVKKENGKDYVKITNSTLPHHISGMSIHLDNLFNGDKLLGNNMNQFLNENWKDILKEVGPAVADALGSVFRQTMDSMAELVPYDTLFPPN